MVYRDEGVVCHIVVVVDAVDEQDEVEVSTEEDEWQEQHKLADEALEADMYCSEVFGMMDDDDDDVELELVLHTVEEQVEEEEDYRGEQVLDTVEELEVVVLVLGTVEELEVVLVLDTVEEEEVGEDYDELVHDIIEVEELQHDDEV